MIFELILILLLIIFMVCMVIYYMFSYKRLMVITSPTFVGPLTQISLDTLNSIDTNLKEKNIQDILQYSTTNINEPPLIEKKFKNKKLSLYHNDLGYSYTFFIKIDNLDYKYNSEKDVFRKGESVFNPRVFIDKKINNLIISVATYTDLNEEIVIEDIPIQSWVFLGIVLHNKTVDIYINGALVKSHTLEKLPSHTYPIITYGDNEGFDGSLNDLIYYFYPLSSLEILNIFNKSKHLLQNTEDTKQKLDSLLQLKKSKKKIKTCYE